MILNFFRWIMVCNMKSVVDHWMKNWSYDEECHSHRRWTYLSMNDVTLGMMYRIYFFSISHEKGNKRIFFFLYVPCNLISLTTPPNNNEPASLLIVMYNPCVSVSLFENIYTKFVWGKKKNYDWTIIIWSITDVKHFTNKSMIVN